MGGPGGADACEHPRWTGNHERLDPRGIGQTTLDKIQIFSNENNLTVFDIVEDINNSEININNGTKQKLFDFVTMIKSFQIVNENLNALEILNEVLKRVGVVNLLKNEGLSLGPSSGINIAGAVKLAKILGPGHTIATILCDNGTRYASKIYNKKFLESKKLPIPSWLK